MYMKRFAATTAAVLFSALLATPAVAKQPSMTTAQAKTLIAPFYDALNKPVTKDVAGLIGRVTSEGWVSCGGNDACGPRDVVARGIAGLGALVPDLKWEIKDVLVSGNQITVRGEASGTPTGPFLGLTPTGRSFKTMSIDVHVVEKGKIVRTYHVEDWAGATNQLNGK
jgi:predicted ester cyclase